jgi:2'-5' RNA ligase
MPGRRVNEQRESKKRLFFALWPDETTRSRLAKVAHQWTRRPVPADNLHVTLQFLGACNAEQEACYIEAASTIQAEAFELQLDYLSGWPRKHIQWLGTSQPPAALANLVAMLDETLEVCGYQPEKRRFVPHLTLSRKEKNPRTREGLPVIDWAVNEFVLAESVGGEGGVHYVVRARWPLG